MAVGTRHVTTVPTCPALINGFQTMDGDVADVAHAMSHGSPHPAIPAYATTWDLSESPTRPCFHPRSQCRLDKTDNTKESHACHLPPAT